MGTCEMIDLMLLGTGAMVPLPERPLSALQLRFNGSLVLFDCGEGTQVQMRRFHWGFRALAAICLSHLHADHVAGLPGLLHTVANAGRTEPLHIYGPPGTGVVVSGLRVIASWLPFEVVVHEIEDGDRFELLPGLDAHVREGEHRIPCFGWKLSVDRAPAFDPVRAVSLEIPRTFWSRLQRGESVEVGGTVVGPDEVLAKRRQGVSFAFVTDTRSTHAITELVRDVDLLVCESTFGRDEDAEKAARRGHMTMREACQLASNAGAGALWLTHFGGTIEKPGALTIPARRLFPNVTIGYPGLAGTVSFDRGYHKQPGQEAPA
jgi:ribonuclease Z